MTLRRVRNFLAELLCRDVFIRMFKLVADQEVEIKDLQRIIAHTLRFAESTPTNGKNWVVIAYRVGDKDYVKLYDFGRRNIGAIRDMLDRFERAGIEVQKNPVPATKKGGRNAR